MPSSQNQTAVLPMADAADPRADRCFARLVVIRDRSIWRELELEARQRKILPGELGARLLAATVADRLVGAVLDDGERE